jgi:hypothetical protein
MSDNDILDNDILDAVRQTLSGVRMDRPVETIMQRGRNRRQVRLLSRVAGGGLAVLVGAALAVPMLTGSTDATTPRPGSAFPPPATNSTGSPQLGPAAWTVDLLSNDTVRLTLLRADLTDVGLLEKKLAEVKVPAYVRVASQCDVHGTVTDAIPSVVTAETGDWPLIYVIQPSAIPSGAHLVFTTYPDLKDPRAPIAVNVYLAPAATSVVCKN